MTQTYDTPYKPRLGKHNRPLRGRSPLVESHTAIAATPLGNVLPPPRASGALWGRVDVGLACRDAACRVSVGSIQINLEGVAKHRIVGTHGSCIRVTRFDTNYPIIPAIRGTPRPYGRGVRQRDGATRWLAGLFAANSRRMFGVFAAND